MHANVAVDGRDRKRLERLVRYVARPPLAQERLELHGDGRVRLRFKRPWKNGTDAVLLDPLDFIARLCALVPPPRFHTIRYHGVLSAHAAARREVVPGRSPSSGEQLPLCPTDDNVIVFGPVAGGSSLVPPVSRVESCANNVYLFVGTAADLDTTLRGDIHPDGGNNGERIAALNGRFAGCIDVRSKPAGTTVDAFLAAEGWTARVAAWRASHVAGATGL